MTVGTHDGDDLVLGAVDDTGASAQPALVKKTAFLPWHKPRKHYVRIHQWCVQTRSLAERRKADFVARPFRYLGLPGDDLIDVRMLQDALPEGVRLSYLGFNSRKNAESSLSEIEVNELDGIDSEHSNVLPDRFEQLSDEHSIAARCAREFAPFDVVNLDLCGSAAKTSPTSDQTVFHALHEIMKLQHEKGASEWLLFLTTRADRSGADPVALRMLLGCIGKNITASPDFGAKVEENLGIDQESLVVPSSIEASSFVRAFGLGIGKWLLGTIGQAWEVELHADNFWYVVAGDVPDMLSLSFRFQRCPSVSDSTGLTGPANPVPPRTDESVMGQRMVDALMAIVDPDAVLRDDPKKKQKILQQARKVLEEARFDGDAYVKWVEEQT